MVLRTVLRALVTSIAGIAFKEWLPRWLATAARMLKISALDRVLQDSKNKTNNKYTLYVGGRDVMHDNLIAEAISVGISAEKIVHAMFSCEESLSWIRHLLKPLDLDNMLGDTILNVLYFGKTVDHYSFAEALLSVDDGITFGASQDHEELDLSDYYPVSELHIEEGGMKAYQHHGGVYRIVGKTITCALVPHPRGVQYYRRKQETNFFVGLFLKEPIVHTSGKNAHLVQETVDELVNLRCEDVLAWRLVAATMSPRRGLPVGDSETVIQAFQVVSCFHTELWEVILDAERNPLHKRLLGTKSELTPEGGGPTFVLDKSMYAAVKHLSALRPAASPLEPFLLNFLELDQLETHMTLLSRLIEQARNSDVNEGSEEQNGASFDAGNVVVLGALLEVPGSALSSHGRRQYVYQEDVDTKCLCTPFSNLMIFAATNSIGLEIHQVQQLESTEMGRLENWIALRAAFEFDASTEKFCYDTKEFELANKLVDESIAKFIRDTTRRFSDVFEASPTRITVSSLTDLCEKIAGRTGASSAWLAREMISRYIAKGARVERCAHDSYGRMETALQQNIDDLPVRDKVLDFDCKVNIEGVCCRVGGSGKVEVCQQGPHREHKPNRIVLRFVDQEGAQNDTTAKEWLRRGACQRIDVVAAIDVAEAGFGWTVGDFHVVERNHV